MTHSTITGNSTSGAFGAGIQVASGSATLDHTIVALNSNSASTRSDVGGAVTARFSLISDNNGATITDNGGNLFGTATAPIDPRLGPLVNNGGRTLTHALLPLSPAIDAGDPAKVAGVGGTPLFDQRGNPNGRVLNSVGAIGTGIDIGAFEGLSRRSRSLSARWSMKTTVITLWAICRCARRLPWPMPTRLISARLRLPPH